jgi:DNA polymerase I
LLLAFDSETFTFRPGLLAPPPVIFSFARDESNSSNNWLHRPAVAAEYFRQVLPEPEVIFVTHNGPYDWAVLGEYAPDLLPLIFQAFEDGRVRDTKIRQELLDIRDGRRQQHGKTYVFRNNEWVVPDYSLAGNPERPGTTGLVGQYLGKDRSAEKGPDAWRLRYGELDSVPLEAWPEAACDYALLDSADTLEVYHAQQAAAGDYVVGDALVNEREQVYAAFALHLISCWGMRSDKAAVEELAAKNEVEYTKLRETMLREGLLRPDRCSAEDRREGKIDFWAPAIYKANKKHPAEFEVDGVGYYYARDIPEVAWRYVKDQEAIRARVKKAYEELGEPVPLTDKGAVKMDSDALENSGDELLEELSGAGTVMSVRNVFLPILRRGLEVPINTRFQPLLNTGRISSADPNLNNIPRGGGVRECFVPREGYYFCSVDYDCAELRSHSQVCYWMLGYSTQAEFFRASPTGDPHLELAASILGITPEEALARKNAGDPEVKGLRQACKALNFGLPGGMGWKKLKATARKQYGVIFTDEEAQLRVRQWKEKWREMQAYLRKISQMVEAGERPIEQLRYVDGKRVPHRIRGGCGYSDGANTLFQGLTADAAKYALTQVAHECYVDRGTALFGCRVIAFLYDEIIIEVPIEYAHEAANRLAEVMCTSAQKWIPDVPITATPALMERWYKGAEAAHNDDGKLVPWRPKAAA